MEEKAVDFRRSLVWLTLILSLQHVCSLWVNEGAQSMRLSRILVTAMTQGSVSVPDVLGRWCVFCLLLSLAAMVWKDENEECAERW